MRLKRYRVKIFVYNLLDLIYFCGRGIWCPTGLVLDLSCVVALLFCFRSHISLHQIARCVFNEAWQLARRQ